MPNWICGDSDKVIEKMTDNYDFVFSCPPYYDLEVYSKDKDDLSNMSYKDFKNKYYSIIKKTVDRLKHDRFAVFVVGDIRDENGFYRLFPQTTCQMFDSLGCKLYNEIILANSVGSAAMRAYHQFSNSRKVAKTHQTVLVFFK